MECGGPGTTILVSVTSQPSCGVWPVVLLCGGPDARTGLALVSSSPSHVCRFRPVALVGEVTITALSYVPSTLAGTPASLR
jgi:hypothetical protein